MEPESLDPPDERLADDPRIPPHMRVAIVGAGFYGCYLARAVAKRRRREAVIHVFERGPRPMMRAATNNQSRLHLGFHYPRSPETIRQTIQGWRDFREEFGACLHFPSRNLYAVSRDGLTRFGDYLKAMDAFDLPYAICGPEVHRYFRDPQSLDGVIRADEGVIDLEKLDAMLLSEMHAAIRCSALVTEIDGTRGTLRVNGTREGPYDFIINATYVDPNLGLPDAKRFELKYELAALVVMDAPFGEDVGLTIMDGGFVSLYPCGGALATLSSVTYTPFALCNTVGELEASYARAEELARELDVAGKILAHGEEFLAIKRDCLKVRGVRIAPKAKLRQDPDATRISAIRSDGRVISVLCGKLDAVHAVADQVLALMERGPFP
jgi:hypothetical protein